MSGAVDAYLIIDARGVIVEWSDGAAGLLGYAAEEARNRPASFLFPDGDPVGCLMREMDQARAAGPLATSRWHVRRDGMGIRLDCTLIPVRMTEREPVGYLRLIRPCAGTAATSGAGIGVDLAAALDSLPEAVIVGDRDRVIHVNRRARTCFGIGDAPPPGTREFFAGLVSRCAADAAVAVDEHPFLCALDGTPAVRDLTLEATCGENPVVLRCSAAPIRQDDRVIGAVAVHSEISEQVRAAKLLVEANRELEHFAAVASHDLQEPLRLVASYVGLLQTRLADGLNEATASYFATITETIARMRRLITDLLRLASIGREQIEPTWVECAAAVQEAIRNLDERIGRTAATITWGDLPRVLADRTQLVLLFQNLLGNAMKYSRQGVPPVIRIEGRRRENDVLISVSDNGMGIDECHRKDIFTAFRRLHSQGDIPGTGLGLSICHKIVSRHHGAIWVDSQPGQGSTFFFTLGLQEPPEAGAPGTASVRADTDPLLSGARDA